jgi:hypothetical protein
VRESRGSNGPAIRIAKDATREFSSPGALKFSSYFPYNAKLCINGHEWAKRQASKAGIGHTALDNGFATDPAAVQAICDQLGPA